MSPLPRRHHPGLADGLDPDQQLAPQRAGQLRLHRNLVNQPGNYELWVYAPDNTLLGISSDDAIVDRKVQVTNQGVGNYWVVIKSHNGDCSANPYTLYSSTITAVTAIPISSYDATPVTRTGGYRTAP